MVRMPSADPLVVQAFIDCGISQSNGMGESPISWSEINAYSLAIGNGLTLFEKRMIRLMSKEYLTFKSFATEHRTARSNYQPKLTEEDILKRAERMARII